MLSSNPTSGLLRVADDSTRPPLPSITSSRLSPPSHLQLPTSPVNTHRRSTTPFINPRPSLNSARRPSISRPSSTLAIPGEPFHSGVAAVTSSARPVSTFRRRRLHAQPARDFSDSAQYSADVRDRLCRFMNAVDVPPGVTVSEDLTYKYVDNLIDASEVVRVSRLPADIQRVMPDQSESRKNLYSKYLPSLGVSAEYCSMWWAKGSSLYLWHWPSSSSHIYEIATDDPIVSAVFVDSRFDKSTAECFPTVPEIQLMQSMREQWQANTCMTAKEPVKEKEIRFSTLVILTKSYLLRVCICGSHELGIIDHVPLMYSKVTVEGSSVTALEPFHPSGLVFLADERGSLYEYQSDHIKSAYVKINYVRGGRLESIGPSESSIFSRLTGQDKRSALSHSGHLKKIFDVRRVVDRVSFSQNPYIKQICIDAETGRLHLLTTASEIYIGNVQPPLMTLEVTKSSTYIKIMDRDTILRKDAIVSHDSLMDSILDFSENVMWNNSQNVSSLHPSTSPSNRFKGGMSLSSRHEGSRATLKQELKHKLTIVALHCLSAESILLVMSDGTRCYLNSCPKGKSWNHLPLMGPSVDLAGSSGRGIVSNRLFLRNTDSRIWRLLQEGPTKKPIFDTDLIMTLAHVKLAPPGLRESSVIRRLIEGYEAENSLPDLRPGLSVSQSHYSSRCGGMLLLDIASSTDSSTNALLAICSGPVDDRGRVSLDYCQWIRTFDSAIDENATPGLPREIVNRSFVLYQCTDLPLPPAYARFEQGSASPLFSLHKRLSITTAYAIASTIASRMSRSNGRDSDPSAVSILADALAVGQPLESLEWGTSGLTLPGPAFMSILRPQSPFSLGLYSMARIRQPSVLKACLVGLERLVASLLSELSLVVRVPAITGVVADSPDAAVRLLQSQIGQQLPAMLKWASLASVHRVVVPQDIRRNVGHEEIGETRALFYVDYRDASLDQLWQLLVSEFRASGEACQAPVVTGETSIVRSEGTAMRTPAVFSLAPMTPGGGTQRVSRLARADSVLRSVAIQKGETSVTYGTARSAVRSGAYVEDIAAKLIVLLPVLCGFCDTRGKMITSESSRVQSILRCLSRFLQPFCSAPMFQLEAGLPCDSTCLSKQLRPPPSPPAAGIPIKDFSEYQSNKEVDESASPSFKNGRKRLLQAESSPAEKRPSGSGGFGKARRLLTGQTSSFTARVPLLGDVIGASRMQYEELIGNTSEPPCLDMKLKSRFSTAELQEGKLNCEALLRAIQFYEKILMSSIPQELRNKISDDIARMNEICLYLNSAIQMFSFFICITQELEGGDLPSDRKGRATSDAAIHCDPFPIKLIEPHLFDSLAIHTFNDLLCEVFRSSSTETSTLHRWLLSPLSGGIVNLIPPVDLLKDAPHLFGHHFLLWQSSLEPLKCLSSVLRKFEIERRAILNEQLFELSRREPAKLAALRLKHKVHAPSQAPPTEKTPFQTSPSRDETNETLDIVAMLEFMWADWTSRASPQVLKDLLSCLPLPYFLESPGQHLNVITLRPRDDTADESKKELRDHVLTALMCLASLSQSRLVEFHAIESLLELFFEIHAFDAFVVGLAMWSHHLQRPSSAWRSNWNVHTGPQTETETLVLQPQCSKLLHDFLNRLLYVSRQTEDWLGRDMADLLVLQLTKRPLPSLSNLWQLLSSSSTSNGDGMSTSTSLILTSTDGAAVASFVASFDNARRLLEEAMANETFLWIVSQGESGNFPRPLAALNSPHLPKWLDRISMSASVSNGPTLLSDPRVSSVTNVALAVCEYMFMHGDSTRAIEYSLKFLQESPKWLTFPMTYTRLIELSVDMQNIRNTSACSTNGQKENPERTPLWLEGQNRSGPFILDVFPSQTLSVSRGIVASELAEDIRALLNGRWIVGIQDDWRVVYRWLMCLRRIGSLPIDMKLKLLEKVQSSHPDCLRHGEFGTATTAQRPIEIRDIYKRARIQLNLLNDLLEFTCLLLSGDSEISSMIIEIILECNSSVKDRQPQALTTDSARQTLINNLTTFYMSVLHTLMASQYAIAEAIIDFITCLKGFAPFPASVLLEAWESMSSEESRNRLVRKPLIRKLQSAFISMSPTTLVTIVSMTYTLKSRNILAKRTQSLGYLEDSALRYWNIFADSKFVESGVPKINSQWLSKTTGDSRHEGSAIQPIALYLILDRILRCNYNGRNYQKNASIFNMCLQMYFTSPTSSHTEKLRCSELGGITFMKVLPVEESDTITATANSVRLLEEQFEVIGCLSCFSLDVALRSWIWELVGLCREPTTGARYTNSKELVNRDATLTTSNLKAIFEWINNAIVALELIVDRLLDIPDGSSITTHTTPRVTTNSKGTFPDPKEVDALITWLDTELPMNTGTGTVQHLTLVEATHALGVCLHDLHTLVAWAASAFLPEAVKRLVSSHVILLSEAPTADTSRNSLESTGHCDGLSTSKEKFGIDAGDLEVKKKGWTDIARMLVEWSQRARVLLSRTIIKEVLFRQRKQAGWDGTSTRLLQTLLSKITYRSSLLEREITPALIAYVNTSNQPHFASLATI